MDEISVAKHKLPLPDLMRALGCGEAAKSSACSPLRQESSPSFGIFQKEDGNWCWKDQANGERGDEIDFLAKYKGLDQREARELYFTLAGVDHLPVSRPNCSKFEAAMKGRPIAPKVPAVQVIADNSAGFIMEALPDEEKPKLAEWRGFSPEFVEWLWEQHLVGWHENGVAFPVHKDGRLIGCHYRKGDGSWRYSSGATAQPLVIGDPKTADNVFFLESQWDALAMADVMGFHDGRVSAAFVITRGAGNGKMIAGIAGNDARLIAVPQNDQPKKDGSIPAEKWMADVLDAAGRAVHRLEVPREHKDLNDWLRAGLTQEHLAGLLDKVPSSDGISRLSLADLSKREINKEDTLLGWRWLCRKGTLLFVAPSGIGKSSASTQMDALWSLGRPAFGIKPTRPLRILTAQVENDEGDLIEMSRGVLKGLELTPAEIEVLGERTRIVTLSGVSGEKFFKALRKEMADFRPDIVRIDPVTGFFNGDVKDSEAVNIFCRQQLQPLVNEFNCGCILVVHTPKTNHRDTSSWSSTDWQYAAAGAADWTNHARAALVVDPGAYPVFKFIATKRGGRIGWLNQSKEKEAIRLFKHNTEDGNMFWRDATVEEQTEYVKAPKGKGDLLDLLPTDKVPIEKKALVSRAKAIGIGEKRAELWIAELIHDKMILEVLVPRTGTRPQVQVRLA